MLRSTQCIAQHGAEASEDLSYDICINVVAAVACTKFRKWLLVNESLCAEGNVTDVPDAVDDQVRDFVGQGSVCVCQHL